MKIDDWPRIKKMLVNIGRDIEELAVPFGLTKILYEAGIRTIGELVVHTEDDIREIPEMKAFPSSYLREALEKLELGFGMYVEDSRVDMALPQGERDRLELTCFVEEEVFFNWFNKMKARRNKRYLEQQGIQHED